MFLWGLRAFWCFLTLAAIALAGVPAVTVAIAAVGRNQPPVVYGLPLFLRVDRRR